MTTIAYKDGILASDSLISNSCGVAVGKMCKVAKGKSTVGAAAGVYGDVVAFLAWVTDHDCDMAKRPKFEGALNGLIVYSDGALICIDGNFAPGALGVDVAAIGAGLELALGAMAAGASAEQAVAIACDLDLSSGLPVHHVRLEGILR